MEPELWAAPMKWPVFSASNSLLALKLKRQGIIPRTLIDVGANIGQFSSACAMLYPGVSIIAFEPVPECYGKLTRIQRRYRSFLARQMALGASKEITSFYQNSYSHSSSLLPLTETHREAFPHACDTERIQVRCSTLDDEIDPVQIVEPVLLKIDVQGAEEAVLKGGKRTLNRVRWILVESSFKPLYEGERVFEEINSLLLSQGFVFRRPVAVLPDARTGEILQMDALFEKQRTDEPNGGLDTAK